MRKKIISIRKLEKKLSHKIWSLFFSYVPENANHFEIKIKMLTSEGVLYIIKCSYIFHDNLNSDFENSDDYSGKISLKYI